jgi:primosomal protein N' (replication factor Y)
VLGPAPAPLARLRDRWRFHLLLKSRDRVRTRQGLRAGLAAVPSVEDVAVGVDVDPLSLL